MDKTEERPVKRDITVLMQLIRMQRGNQRGVTFLLQAALMNRPDEPIRISQQTPPTAMNVSLNR